MGCEIMQKYIQLYMFVKREAWQKPLTSILHVCHESRRYECCDEKCDDDESGQGPQLFEPTSSLRKIDNMNGVVPRAVTTWRGGEGRGGGESREGEVETVSTPKSINC